MKCAFLHFQMQEQSFLLKGRKCKQKAEGLFQKLLELLSNLNIG